LSARTSRRSCCSHSQAGPRRISGDGAGLDGRIEREDIGLKRDAFDHADDVGHVRQSLRDAPHGRHHIIDRVAALSRVAASFRRGVRALGGVVGILRDGAREFFHARRRLFVSSSDAACDSVRFDRSTVPCAISLAASAIATLDD
jgi:hypothetical protein